MKRFVVLVFFVFAFCATQAAPPSLTIYNSGGSGFAVVRQSLPLDLHEGENDIHCNQVTSQIDPGSVILRDPAGKTDLRILEQKYSGVSVTEENMLAMFEGQTIPFRRYDSSATRDVNGKIVRASPRSGGGGPETIVEVDGHYLFTTPGTPMFPKLPNGVVLRPELYWKIATSKPVKMDAELVFLTDGLSWEADYNAITTEKGDINQLVGWITIKNNVGAHFDGARVKVIAGNVPRIPAGVPYSAEAERVITTGSNIPTAEEVGPTASTVQRKNFDEYHEYILARPVTLREGETSQAEFVRANDVNATRSFVYDGTGLNINTPTMDNALLDPQFGVESNTKVVIASEFKNDETHHLGAPLPHGRLHFYRLDPDGQLQFTGDSAIDNTPPSELVRAVTGNAFDLVGERRQTEFQVNDEEHTATETFEIKLRNHRKEAVEIRVLEHPSRWRQWEITAKSQDFKKIDQRTVEFRVPIKPDEEKTVTYSIRYSRLPAARR